VRIDSLVIILKILFIIMGRLNIISRLVSERCRRFLRNLWRVELVKRVVVAKVQGITLARNLRLRKV